MKILWLCNFPSPYSMKLFNEMGKKEELTILMLGGTEKDRNDEWKISDNLSFKIVIIGNNYIKQIKELAKENDFFIDSLYTSLYALIAVYEFRKLHKKTIMQADGGIVIDRGRIINGIISIIMKRHDYFLSSGPHCDKYFNFYNIISDIYHYRFTSLTSKEISENKKLVKNKKELRDKLGIDNRFTFISVGRPIKGKGFDILLNAYIKTGHTDDINLYIVGGNPQDEIKNIVEENKLNNVHFVGLLGSKELNEYYAACDAFILCTRTDVWGLVIQEAMSFGLPIITSNKCGAGVHYKLLGSSIMLADIEDSDKYSEYISYLFENRKETKKISKESLEMIEEYSIENSTNDILKMLSDI